jgi:subtilisin family serine protease
MPFRGFFILWLFALPPFSSHAAGERRVEGEVLVVFKPGLAADGARRALGRRALALDRHFGKVSRHCGRVAGLVRAGALGTDLLIERLKADPGVETVEPNYLRQRFASVPNDVEFGKLWGLRNTGQTVDGVTGTSGVDANFLPAWRLARRAPFSEVVVGVVDSGVDLGHPDLAANLWTNPGEIAGNGIDDDGNGYTDDVNGYDFAGGSALVSDSDGHGTHVAGTVAAVGKNSAGVIGVGYRAKIVALKAENANGNLSSAAIIEAYDYAIGLKQAGVNVVALNASFGGTSTSMAELLAIEALRDNGIVLCAAAGNDGTNNNTLPVYPASYTTSNIISVAALTQTNTLASFSNYGSTSVDLAAPGVNILSTKPRNLVSTLSSVTAGSTTYASQTLEYAGTTPPAGISGTIHACGIGNPGDFPPAVAGNIALIQRGTLFFSQKVANAMSAGAVAAIIYDNTAASLSAGGWTLGAGTWIPAVQVTQASGLAILAGLPGSGTVANSRDEALTYQFLDGTSMATPHVAGAVAFAAMNFPSDTMAQRIARITGNVTPVPALAGLMASGGRLNLLKMIDTEGDGLPDWWETGEFGDLSRTAAGDEDADGFSNLDEFLAATDPGDAASRLAFSAISVVEDGAQTHLDLAFPSVEDTGYRVEWSGTLEAGSWLPLGAPLTGTGGLLQVRDTDALNAAPRRFYRLGLLAE